MNNFYGICTQGSSWNSYKRHWENFDRDYTLLADVGKVDLQGDNVFRYNEQDIRDNFNFQGEVSKKHYWNSFGNRNIIWFYAHFRMLNYYINNKDYDYYWFFDDDVKCSDWGGFFKGFDDVKTDFIAHHIFKKEGVQANPHIPHLDKRTTSQHMWFERFPGDGDSLPWWVQDWYGSFFPVVRFSNSAMNTLLQQFKWGVWGYSEGFVPTILSGYNHSIGTIFGNTDKSQYFDVDKIKLEHKNEVIKWNWI